MGTITIKRLTIFFAVLALLVQINLVAQEDYTEQVYKKIHSTQETVKDEPEWKSRNFKRWLWKVFDVVAPTLVGAAVEDGIGNEEASGTGALLGVVVGSIWAWRSYKKEQEQNKLEIDLEVVRALVPKRLEEGELFRELAIKQGNLIKLTYGAPPAVAITQSKKHIGGKPHSKVKLGYSVSTEQNHEKTSDYRATLMMLTAEDSNNWSFSLREKVAKAYLNKDTNALADAVRKSYHS